MSHWFDEQLRERMRKDRDRFDMAEVERNPFWCPDAATAAIWAEELDALRKDGNSVGAVIEVMEVVSPYTVAMADSVKAVKVLLQREDQKIDERKLKILEAKATQADQAKEVATSNMTPEQKQEKMRSIFGLA